MKQNEKKTSGGFELCLGFLFFLIIKNAIKSWQKGMKMPLLLFIEIELAFILGCMWYAMAKGRKWAWGLLGLLGPLGIAIVACLENKNRCPSGQVCALELTILSEEEPRKMVCVPQRLCWLFGGMVVFGVASSVVSPDTWSNTNELISCSLGGFASVVLAFCVLNGAKWARVSCYILSIPLSLILLLLWQVVLFTGVIAICDVATVRELFADTFGTRGEAISIGLDVLSIGCLLAGTISLLTEKAQNAFKTIKSSARFGWVLCILFWVLFAMSIAMELLP